MFTIEEIINKGITVIINEGHISYLLEAINEGDISYLLEEDK